MYRRDTREGEKYMNIQQLRCAIEVWRCGSISRAAERLYMNQPNLSRVIKALEEEFNITLFSRTASGVEVTNEGTAFLTEAERLVGRNDEFEQAFKNGYSERLVFRMAVPRASYLAYAFSNALARHGGDTLNVTYKETNNQDVINCVSALGYDLGVIRLPVEFAANYKKQLAEKQLKAQEILTFRFVAVMSRGHALAGRESVRMADLAQHTALVHGDNYSVNFSDKWTDQLYKTGVYQKSVTLFERGSQFDFLRNVPDTFMLVSPLPPDILAANDLVQIPLSENETGLFEDVVITRRFRRETVFEQAFMNSLLDVEHDIMRLPTL